MKTLDANIYENFAIFWQKFTKFGREFSFSCHVFQAFPGEACSETTLLEGAAGGCLRTAPIPRGLLFLKKENFTEI